LRATANKNQSSATVANTPQKSIKLINAGFDYVTGQHNDGKLSRKSNMLSEHRVRYLRLYKGYINIQYEK